MKTSIVILTYNKLEYTRQCIESIRTFTSQDSYELIIVDNHSTDGTVEWLKAQSDIKFILNDTNVGFPKGCNQGIEISKGDNILLLNNDVIVTENWLNNLVSALYSDPSIGAVGPVTNSAAYYSTVDVGYQSLGEMHQFAKKINKSNPLKWEERLKLIGFCMLIKKSAVGEIGFLDEQFSPGNFEDDDYSVRLRRAGYKLLLCRDTFIHHYGSISWRDNLNEYTHIMSTNEKKFLNKWGINSQSFVIHKELIGLLDYPENKELNILHIGCRSGGTLLELKNHYKSANLFGLEVNPVEGKEAEPFATVMIGNPEDLFEEIGDRRQFDLILITDWKNINRPDVFLKKINRKLNGNGILLTSIANINHFNVLFNLLKGKNPFENQIKYFSDTQMAGYLSEGGFTSSVERIEGPVSKEIDQILNVLCSLSSSEMRTKYKTLQYIFRASKVDQQLLFHLNNIKNNNNAQNELLQLEKYDTEIILDYIVHFFDDSVSILQAIGIQWFSNNKFEKVLPYFKKALDIEPNNRDSLFNIAFVLQAFSEAELAIQYLDKVVDKDPEMADLHNLLVEQLNKEKNQKQELKFLLRRIEFDIEIEKNKALLLKKINEGIFSNQDILETIKINIVDKVKILQTLAITFFENQLYDNVLPWLNLAVEIDKENIDTLFNLGSVLLFFGENELAVNYLERILEKDDQVLELISIARGKAKYE